ncbi:hypothetical protein DFR50_1235 [Roseiarcus fermentans]|uniref:Uncharacterized protein n=2 Tax=Roseiarcus fermentans TaxID=1473586 RepID=A0A366F4F8_9HYPH|nr:hypothetical protein DFR50_1235 [Roseiarcus fermentans]
MEPKKDPRFQMTDQAEAALASDRGVIWHVQTPKGFRGLNVIAQRLDYGNLTVVYDPNGKGEHE